MLCEKCGTPSQGDVCPVCGNVKGTNNEDTNSILKKPEQSNMFIPQKVVEEPNSFAEQPNMFNEEKEEEPNLFEQQVKTMYGRQPNDDEENNISKDKSKKNINFKLIIGIVCAIVVITLGIVILPKLNLFNNKINKNIESDYFFLSNGSKYAVFDVKGNKITDFLYDNNSYFHNDIAYVTEQSVGKIIDEKGNVLVDTNDTRRVTGYNSFYVVYENDINKLYTAKGNLLLETKELGIKSTENEHLLMLNDGKYILYDKDGNKLIEEKEEPKKNDFLQEGSTNKYGYLLVFIQGKNYLYNTNNKLLQTFSSEQQYCMDELEDKRIKLTHCKDVHSTQQKDKKVIDNDKVYDIPDQCGDLVVYGTQLMCKTSEGTKFINSNYELGRLFSDKDSEQFFDENNYVIKKSNKLEFFKNGKLVKALENLTIKSDYYTNPQKDDFYILYDNNDNLYYCYNKDGKKLFNKGFTGIDKTSKGIYRVRTNEGKYYLMNSKGNKVSKEYDNIYVTETENNKYLEVTIDGIKKILNKNENKVIYSCSKDSDIYIRTRLGIDYALIKGDKNVIVDLKTGNEIITSTSDIYDNNMQYIRVDNTYYTYQGKQIYKKED